MTCLSRCTHSLLFYQIIGSKSNFIHIVIKIVLYPYSYKNCILFLLCSPFALLFRNFEGIGTRALYVQASELQCGRLAQRVFSSRIHLKQYRRVFLLLISYTDLAHGHSRPNLYPWCVLAVKGL